MRHFTLAFSALSSAKPRKPVEGVNFSLAYNQATGLCAFTVLRAPDSTAPITDYSLTVTGVPEPIILTGTATFAFNPIAYPGAWRFGVAEWIAEFQVAARSSYGLGAWSDAVEVTIKQETSYFIGSTYSEVRDSATAAGVTGKQKMIVPAFTPRGLELRRYSGALTYTSNNFVAIQSIESAPTIAPGATWISTTGLALGTTAHGILLWRDSARNAWYPASQAKQFTVQGIIAVPLPSFVAAPAITATNLSNPVLGTLLTATYTGSGDTSHSYQWKRAGTAIAGATNATYTLVAADDLKLITVTITLTNATGSLAATSPGISVNYSAPAPVSTIGAQAIDQEPGAYKVLDIVSNFTGSGLTYEVSGHSAVGIHPTLGVLSFYLNAVVAPVTITVTARNASGSATQQFTFSVLAHAATLTWPANPAIANFTASLVVLNSVAAAQGFAGEPGHIKAVYGALTVSSGDYSLREELLGDTNYPHPSAALSAVVASSTKYTTKGREVGGVVQPRLWWRNTVTGHYKIALEASDITVVALSDGEPEINWPAITGVGTAAGQARSKALPYYDLTKNGAGNMSYFGPAMVATAYASWRGDTTTDAYTVSCIKNVLGGGRDPSMSMGYPAQHQMYFGIAVYFVTQIPRLWTGNGTFSAAEKTRIDLLMKAGGIAGATCSRESGDSGNAYSLIGWNNPSTRSDNPNFRSASRSWPFILSAYLGGVTAGKAYLDSVTTGTLNTLYTNLVAQGLSNCAASFNPTRRTAEGPAPTYATIVNKCTDWTTFGDSILDPTPILAREINDAFDEPVTTGYNNGAGTPGSGGTRGKFAGSVAGNAEYAAIAGDIGRCHEYESGDAEGQRSSASYSTWACWAEFGFALICLASGIVLPTDSRMKSAIVRMKVGIRYQRLVTNIGYLSWAHDGGNGSETFDSNDIETWGTVYRNAIGDVVVSVVEAA